MSTKVQRGNEPTATELLGHLDAAGDFEISEAEQQARRGRWLINVMALVVVITIGAAGIVLLAKNIETRGPAAVLTHTVKQGELMVTITEDGNIESGSNVQVKCEVAGGSTILWIIEDGKLVEEGEVLARLDSSQLEEQVTQQRITYETARSAMIQAQNDFEVAKLALQEYLEGTYKKEIQDLDAQITIAMENLRSAENTLQYTQRMFRKGYTTPLQLEEKEFAVKRAQLELDSAKTAKDVLERFTKEKALEDLRAQRDTAEAKLNSQKASFELEEMRLKRLEAQLEKCEIRAPQAGMAVYANEAGRSRFGSQQPQIEEGAMVRERQDVFRIPDLSQMQVKVAVHESKVDQLRRGMRARIRVQDRQFTGQVESVASQPEPTSFFSANVKEYATTVKIDGQPKELKPGMTAEVEILVANLKDVLTLPVAAVVEQRGQFFCWVRTGDEFERRQIQLGQSNDEFIEIKDGVAAGDQVALNPREVIQDAREQGPEEREVNVEDRFGRSEDGAAEPAPKRYPAGEAPPGGPERRADGVGPGGPPGITDAVNHGRGEAARPGPAGSTPEPGAGGDGGRQGRGGPGGGRSFNPVQLDTDGDGKISRSEAPGRMAERFDSIDANGDGFLDSSELDAMRSRFSGGRSGAGGPPDRGGEGASR